MQYVMGFKKLGHDVLFLEWSEDYEACYDPTVGGLTNNADYGLRFIRNVFKTYGLETNWAFLDEHTGKWSGQSKQYVTSFLKSTDILINLSGITSLRDVVRKIPVRVFLDTDPLFTQIRHLKDKRAKEIAHQHTHHFTFAENINHPSCNIPDDGFEWKITRQPVVIEEWKVLPHNPKGAFTTVMQWDSYKSQEHNGTTYGMKSRSFSMIEDLPGLINQTFEIAVGSKEVPEDYLIKKGWKLLDPLEVTKSPATYQEFISKSKAEFTIAKHGYVSSLSGWFSERSAAYLASGRPVITQETGFSRLISTKNGLFSFSESTEAIQAIEEINANYNYHCRAARELAEASFNYRVVLKSMLDQL